MPAPSPIPTAALQKEHYIRTYAMDLARVTNKPEGTVSNIPATKAAPPTATRTGNHSFLGVLRAALLPQPRVHEATIAPATATHEEQPDESLIVHGQPPGTPELSQLEKDAEIRDMRATQAEKEISAELRTVEPPTPEPLNLPPVSPEEAQKDREQILARLRQAAEQRETPTPAANTPTVSFADDVRESMRERMHAQAVEQVTPPQPQPSAPPSPESVFPYQVPVIPEKLTASAPKPIITPVQPAPFHSYSSDFASRVDRQNASTFSVLAAQKDAAPQPQPKAAHRRIEYLPIAAGVVLLVGSAIGILATYHYMQSKAPTPLSPTIPSLIPADQYVSVSGTYLAGDFVQLASRPLQQNQIIVAYVTQSTTTQQGIVQIPQPGGVLIADLKLPAPDILLRNIDQSSTVGVINDGIETRPFFLLHVDSYDRTFIGMLDWEPTIATDLSQYYPAYATTSTTTGTTTTPQQFTDAVVASHSVRILRDSEGRSILLYGYTADKQILIIARDEAAFTLLLNRLSASGN